MRKTIGAILPNLFPSEKLDFALNQENIVIFVKDNISFFESQSTPIFSIHNVQDFKGELLVFDLESAEIALNIFSQVTVHFYAMDIEWLRGANNFINNYKIYNQVDFLYTYKDYVKVLENYCGRKPIIINEH